MTKSVKCMVCHNRLEIFLIEFWFFCWTKSYRRINSQMSTEQRTTFEKMEVSKNYVVFPEISGREGKTFLYKICHSTERTSVIHWNFQFKASASSRGINCHDAEMIRPTHIFIFDESTFSLIVKPITQRDYEMEENWDYHFWLFLVTVWKDF